MPCRSPDFCKFTRPTQNGRVIHLQGLSQCETALCKQLSRDNLSHHVTPLSHRY